MELRVDVILYSKLGNENNNAGHTKCSRGLQISQPCHKQTSAKLCIWSLVNLYMYFMLAAVAFAIVWQAQRITVTTWRDRPSTTVPMI